MDWQRQLRLLQISTATHEIWSGDPEWLRRTHFIALPIPVVPKNESSYISCIVFSVIKRPYNSAKTPESFYYKILKLIPIYIMKTTKTYFC